MASLRSSVRLLSSIRQGAATISRQPETSCAKRIGVASCKWVRPILMISGYASSSPLKDFSSRCAAGSTF